MIRRWRLGVCLVTLATLVSVSTRAEAQTATLAGEFSFSIAVALALLSLGLVINGLRTGRRRWQAALCIALAMLCHVIVETPVNLTERQRELLHEFEAISRKDPERHNPRAKSWMDKVKEFFAE